MTCLEHPSHRLRPLAQPHRRACWSRCRSRSALAVLVNAVYIVKQRVEKIGRPTGMDDANMIWVASAGFAQDYDYEAAYARGPRVAARPARASRPRASSSNMPLSGGGSSSGFQARPGQVGPKETVPGNKYDVDEQAIAGARREARSRAGLRRRRRSCRRRRPTRIVAAGHRHQGVREGAVPERTERAGQDRSTTASASRSTIVGIIDNMQGAWVGWDKLDNVVLFPRIKNGPTSIYLVRTEPGRRDARDARHRGEARRLEPGPPAALGAAVRLLHRPVLPRRPQHGDLPGERHQRAARDHRARHLRPRDVQRQHAHPPDRHASRRRRAASWTSCGTSWSRTGWSRPAGVVAGCGAALGVGYWISVEYELPRLDLYYLVGGVLAIWADRPRRGPAAGAARLDDLARGREPHGLRLRHRVCNALQRPDSAHPSHEGQAGTGTSGQLGRSHRTRHRRQRGRAHGPRRPAVHARRARRRRGLRRRRASTCSRASPWTSSSRT